jgi:hypothetical protein
LQERRELHKQKEHRGTPAENLTTTVKVKVSKEEKDPRVNAGLDKEWKSDERRRGGGVSN